MNHINVHYSKIMFELYTLNNKFQKQSDNALQRRIEYGNKLRQILNGEEIG